MISKNTLKKLLAILKQAEINSRNNNDEQALVVQSLYPEWDSFENGATLEVGLRVNYNDILYKVIQEHQKQENWNPVDSSSLFAKVLIENPDVITAWEQPNSTNAYMIGNKVSHNGKNWESLVDNNVWEPGVTGTESLWKEL